MCRKGFGCEPAVNSLAAVLGSGDEHVELAKEGEAGGASLAHLQHGTHLPHPLLKVPAIHTSGGGYTTCTLYHRYYITHNMA